MFLRNLTNLRKKQHDVFTGGRYIAEVIPTGDNPIVDVHTFGKDHVIKGAIWESPKGKRVMYVVNSDSVTHTVTLPDGKSLTIEPITGKRINL